MSGRIALNAMAIGFIDPPLPILLAQQTLHYSQLSITFWPDASLWQHNLRVNPFPGWVPSSILPLYPGWPDCWKSALQGHTLTYFSCIDCECPGPLTPVPRAGAPWKNGWLASCSPLHPAPAALPSTLINPGVHFTVEIPGGSVGRIHLPSRRCGFNPWIGKTPWRRKWQPTPAFLPGKSHGKRSLADYSPRGHKEQDAP